MKLIDLTGKRFGHLLVLSHHHTNKFSYGTKHYWLCKCDCGNIAIVYGGYLRSGHTKSCGCLKMSIGKVRNRTHGMSRTRLYDIWANIKGRCFNPKNERYIDYGGRGIKMCSEWDADFMNFYKWAMDNNYSDDLSIDRIDVNGDYCPENCRWVDNYVQANNTRTNHLITFNGKTQTISQWAREYNLQPYTIQSRLKMGWNIKDILEISPDVYNNRDKKLIEFEGEYKTKAEWLSIMKCHATTFYRRLKRYQLSKST